MDRKIAKQILEGFKTTPIRISQDSTIQFARQDETDIEGIEQLTTSELIKEFKDLVWLNEIYGQVSLNEMQRINLIELEMEGRELFTEEFNQRMREWYETETDKLEEEFQLNTPPNENTNTTDDLPF